VLTAFPDEALTQAIRRMGVRNLGQVPVVPRTNPLHPIGMLRRADILRAYSHAMLDRLETQHQRPILPRELRGTRIVEVAVPPGGPLAGRSLATLRLPSNALVIAVERGQKTVIPRGNTQLLGGDHLMILVQNDAVAQLHEHLAAIPSEMDAHP
jgi:hypothetical protein